MPACPIGGGSIVVCSVSSWHPSRADGGVARFVMHLLHRSKFPCIARRPASLSRHPGGSVRRISTECIMDTPYNAATGLLKPVSFSGAAPILARYRAWRDQRRQIARISRELGSYRDSELSDLGLKRADIPDVARGRFRRF
jgi:uncharacterized protein YjiS (DUF1127 family)